MLKKRISDGRMDLSSLRLNKVPIELMCRSLAGQRITCVDLSDNLLTSFSAQFLQFFPDIQELDLHSNKIKRLPENFGVLSSLRRLDLSENQIKKLPISFAELDNLRWLNLVNNPLENDLAEVIGSCSNDEECSFAAKSAVQYVQFFSTVSSESTAIADTAFLQNETSSTSSNNSDNINLSALRQADNAKNQRRFGSPNAKPQQKQIAGLFVSAMRFAFVLTLLTLVGLPIWLTLDSIRDVCVSSASLPSSQSLPDRPWEERRLCAQLTNSLVSGSLPSPFGQFLVDFFLTFKRHWSYAVNDRLMQFISPQMPHFHW
ncbi:hypothetical protein niasHT_005270 [Heterodera trifolii]|uniref:Uncharacterized protein n=1 Tax=Heterodera trifolii TaxID=157864 RepID=A0ABD2LS10_9BILA